MNRKQPGRIGIMGGTFDPIHYGHLLIAQSALEEFDLDQVIFLPTGRSPHKPANQVTEPDIRCAMVRIAIQNNPAFSISTLEADNSEINYTYLTLQKLTRIYHNTHLYFIMGEDSLDDFPMWKQPADICRIASILVAVRDDSTEGIVKKISHTKEIYSADMHLLHAPVFSVSSRDIRERIRNQKNVRYMIQEEVEDFIRKHSLYME